MHPKFMGYHTCLLDQIRKRTIININYNLLLCATNIVQSFIIFKIQLANAELPNVELPNVELLNAEFPNAELLNAESYRTPNY